MSSSRAGALADTAGQVDDHGDVVVAAAGVPPHVLADPMTSTPSNRGLVDQDPKAAAYGVGQGFQRTGPARSGGSLSWPVHETKTGSASAMDDGRVGAGCVVYRWS